MQLEGAVRSAPVELNLGEGPWFYRARGGEERKLSRAHPIAIICLGPLNIPKDMTQHILFRGSISQMSKSEAQYIYVGYPSSRAALSPNVPHGFSICIICFILWTALLGVLKLNMTK